MNTVIGDRGMRLSGGQRQRLTLARAILRDAPILLLELLQKGGPPARSTPNRSGRFRMRWQASARAARRWSSHRLSTVQGADLICVMDGGRIVETGRHRELMVKGGAYAALVRGQGFGE